MPASFNFFRLKAFPKETTFATVEQITLLSDTEENMEEASTEVRLENADFLDGIARYVTTHDFLVKLAYPGRARGKTFKEYVSQYVFPMYAMTAKRKGFTALVVGTKGKVAHDCVERLNHKIESFAADALEVDFNKLRPLIQHIKGAWFGEMKAANLSSTGLFGPHVDLSQEFKHAEGIGKLNALMLQYPHKETLYTVMITKTGGLLLYDAFEAEEPAVELVQDIRSKLLDHVWA